MPGLILGTVAALCLVVVPTPAAAYVDIGYDAEGDSTEESGAYDIRQRPERGSWAEPAKPQGRYEDQ